eukprot:gene26596-33198_t
MKLGPAGEAFFVERTRERTHEEIWNSPPMSPGGPFNSAIEPPQGGRHRSYSESDVLVHISASEPHLAGLVQPTATDDLKTALKISPHNSRNNSNADLPQHQPVDSVP